MISQKQIRGFTLVELLIVIAIIGILSSAGIFTYQNALTKAKAATMASNLRTIKLAWQAWKIDNGDYQFENDYDVNPGRTVPPDVPFTCQDEPVLLQTNLLQNGKNAVLKDTIPTDPFGRQYSYDNDLDTYPDGGKWAGVNVQVHWCVGESQKYLPLMVAIDQLLDKGNGPDAGEFRWDSAEPGGGGLLVAPSSSE